MSLRESLHVVGEKREREEEKRNRRGERENMCVCVYIMSEGDFGCWNSI